MPLPLAVMPVLVLGVSSGGFITSGLTGTGNGLAFVRSVSLSELDELVVLVWDLSREWRHKKR